MELFVLSHADADHVSDIANVHQWLNPGAFLRNRSVPLNLVYPTFPPVTEPQKYFYSFDTTYSTDVGPDHPYSIRPIGNWGGVQIDFLCNSFPDKQFAKLNDYSLVTVLRYGNLRFVFPGDLEAPGWAALMTGPVFYQICTPNPFNQNEVRVLVAAHHGRKAGVYKPFLDLYQPHLSIISDVYGSEYTDANTYRNASLGYWIHDAGKGQPEFRYVLSTKTNSYILVRVYLTHTSIFV